MILLLPQRTSPGSPGFDLEVVRSRDLPCTPGTRRRNLKVAPPETSRDKNMIIFNTKNFNKLSKKKKKKL
jgi:hypothetical protein